jgi:hypothetical protein
VRPILLLFLLATLPLRAAEFSVRPAPQWVDRAAVATDVPVAREHARWGIYDILNDHQVNAGADSETQYYRTVRKVLSPSGVQNASELELDFDPSFQRLVIHEVALVRGAKRIDALDADDIRVLEKEDGSDNQIYDGERTAMIFIKDVRPGDVIDYSWSLVGANPILGGRYTDSYDLSRAVPSRHMRHRLLFPANRQLHWRGRKPIGVAAGATNIYTWELNDVPALDVEDSVPSWFEPWSSVQVSEFASWAEVAQWSEALFALDDRSKAEVKTLAGTFRAQHATRDAQITAAIRFVQDDIRYLGIEMGRNSHEPHQPWETLEARWGDCKDKTLLLVTLLRELGLDAHPALVNTRLQHRLAEKMPSPFLFDHVIAQVVDGAKTYWVDGTIADQGGTLATLETPSDGHALVISPATTGLTRIDTRRDGGTHVEQRYVTTSYTEPVRLEVQTTYSGIDADDMRSEIASLSAEDFAHDRINDLAVDQPKIEAAGTPTIKDDRAANVIVVTEHYRVRELWDDGAWTWYPRVLEEHLGRPDTMIRKMPLAFTWPLNVRQTATFTFPEDVDVKKRTAATDTPAFRYEYAVDRIGHTVTVRQSLRAKADAVEARDVPEHLTKLSGIWSKIGYRLSPDGARAPKGVQAAAATVPSSTQWGLGAFVVAMFIGVAWSVVTRKRRGSPLAPRYAFLPGEAAASALAIAGDDDITAQLALHPCGCGARAYSLPERQHAKYAERELTIVTRQCAACGREQSLYFTAA